MSKKDKNIAHFNLIHTMMSCLPLEMARTLYKCLLAECLRVLKHAQPGASNVGVDILTIKPVQKDDTEVHYYSPDDYQRATKTLAAQWERAKKTSRQALHMLSVTDDALNVGKLRGNVDKWAYGSFDQAIATFDGVDGASDCAVDFTKGEVLEVPQVVVDEPTVVVDLDTEGVPVEPMDEPTFKEEYSTPPVVVNYLVL